MQKIMPCLWFDNQAEEAVNFYISVFKDGELLETHRWGDVGPGPKGGVMLVRFRLRDQNFLALNGGPNFKFTEAISLIVNCETQDEIDYFWEKLSEDGSRSRCGWLKDKYGLSWQIVPVIIGELMRDPRKADNVMRAVLEMDKLDIAAMKRAAGTT
ncbi:MAG: VOC family protein [Alphaproteobacteria bacterium]